MTLIRLLLRHKCEYVWLLAVLIFGITITWKLITETSIKPSYTARCLLDSSTVSATKYGEAPRKFSPQWSSFLNNLCLGDAHISAIDDDQVESTNVVFVTAFSDNHRREALQMFKTFHKKMPNEQLLVYNIGMDTVQLNLLQTEFPFAEFRAFAFHKYPKHVSNLMHYRWKPLIIAEVLTEHPKVVWMDTSMVWLEGEFKLPAKPISLFEFTSHTDLAATNPEMYEFFEVEVEKLSRTNMYSANFMYITANSRVMTMVIRWWVLCALEEFCMAPQGAQLGCNWKELNRTSYAGCHRYDQSAINLLLAIDNNYDVSLYTSEFGKFGTIQR